MRRIWILLMVIALLAVCLAVPALAATDLATQISNATSGAYVKLDADYSKAVTINKEIWLDLNGHDITGMVTITSAGKLHLIDSANNDYTDKNGGVIKNIAFESGATESNNIERVFTTKALQNKGLYDGNHRFLVIKTDAGYSAHRIYLAVKSTILVSNYTYETNSAPTIQYRTLLRCDQTVAGLIGKNYGIQPTYNGTQMGETSYNAKVEYYKTGSTDNNKSTGLVDILKAESVINGTVQSRAEANASACAWIKINDQFGDNNDKKITSAQSSNKSIKEMVELANEKTNLNKSQKNELGKMYDRWGASMEAWGWDVDKVATYSTAVEKCLCGSETSTHKNGCDGTKLTWYEWDLDQKSYMPNEPGNWYLTADTTSTKDGVTYVKLTASPPGVVKEFYNNGLVTVPVYRCTNTVGGETYAQPKFYTTTGETAVAIALTEQDLLTELNINVDINGLKIEARSNSRLFSGINHGDATMGVEEQTVDGEVVAVATQRDYYRYAKMNLAICDTSKDNTGALVAGGVYSKVANTQNSQGNVLWISIGTDYLELHNIMLDASTVRMGWGVAMLTRSETHLYNCHVIGGTSQPYTTGTEKTSNKDPNQKVYAYSISGSTSGGGAITADSGAHVYIHGGIVENGTAIHRYINAAGKDYSDKCYGGGNIYVTASSSLTLDGTADPVIIRNGKALNYDTPNPLATVKYGVGGGVYVCDSASLTVKGDVTVADNKTGTITSAPVTANTGKSNYFEPKDIVTSDLTDSNVYLAGVTMTAEKLTGSGKIGLTLHGYEMVAFANADANYVNNGKFVADEEEGKNVTGVLTNGVLRMKNAAITKYSVGYGMASIHPTDNDIRNGLILQGHNNQTWRTAKEYTRYTRYWYNTDPNAAGMEPTPAYDTVVGTWEELMATCIAITDTDGDTVLLIEVDSCSLNDKYVSKVKSMVSMATGVVQDNITISASHQHSTPQITTVYWENEAGEHTSAVELTPYDGKTTKEDGTELRYTNTIFAGEPLDVHEPLAIRTNYAATFYNGVVAAAKAAMADRAAATIQYGILDTVVEKNQYNFVRNIAYLDSTGKLMGMDAVHHKSYDYYNEVESNWKATYESDMDTTMQLVEFVRQGTNNIIMANFQTHPHMAGGATNLNINADMVGRFRQTLKKLTGAEVLYFSGAGGNVNTSTSISSDDGLLPYAGEIKTKTDEGEAIPDWKQKQQKADIYGNKLATLASSFVNFGSNMTELTAANGFTGDVQVRVEEYEYKIWDEEAYLNNKYGAGTYDRLLAKAKLMVDWETGNLKMTAVKYTSGEKFDFDGDGVVDGTHWKYFVNVNNISEKDGDEIFSYYHVSKIYTRWERKYVTGDMTGTIPITAYDLGGIGFVAAPYEMFQENGQQIKGNVHQVTGKTDYTQAEHFYGLGFVVGENPYPVTIIATCANGGYGYIPSVVGFENGGYSTDTTRYDRGTGENLARQFVNMLLDMHNPESGYIEMPEDSDPADGDE